MLQGFSAVNPTVGTSGLAAGQQSYAWCLVPNIATNSAALTNMLANASINPVGITWYLVSIGFHSIWGTNQQGLSSTVAPPGTTIFTKLYSDGNDLYSAGDFTAGGSTSF